MEILKSLTLFILAGLSEIGGGYLIWLWLKNGKPIWYGVAGAAIMVLYGIIATFQIASFGRVYAAYGGIFIVMALLWAWKFDGFVPDKYDLMGALVILAGVGLIYYTPRA